MSNTVVRVLFHVACFGLAACGGRAVDNELSPEGQEAQREQSREQSDEAPGDEASSPDAPSLLRLGECKGGSMLGEAPCPWMDTDSLLCFPTKEDTCSCICPQDRDSTCISGFYNGEDGNVPVYCN